MDAKLIHLSLVEKKQRKTVSLALAELFTKAVCKAVIAVFKNHNFPLYCFEHKGKKYSVLFGKF